MSSELIRTAVASAKIVRMNRSSLPRPWQHFLSVLRSSPIAMMFFSEDHSPGPDVLIVAMGFVLHE